MTLENIISKIKEENRLPKGSILKKRAKKLGITVEQFKADNEAKVAQLIEEATKKHKDETDAFFKQQKEIREKEDLRKSKRQRFLVVGLKRNMSLPLLEDVKPLYSFNTMWCICESYVDMDRLNDSDQKHLYKREDSFSSVGLYKIDNNFNVRNVYKVKEMTKTKGYLRPFESTIIETMMNR